MLSMLLFLLLRLMPLLYVAAATEFPADADKQFPVEASNEWSGIASRGTPRKGPIVVVSPDQLADLWTKWRDDSPPAVDFSKDFVLVLTAPGPNIITVKQLGVDGHGDLRFKFIWTERASDSDEFGYRILEIPREGIKTVRGKPLPPE